MAYDNRGQGQYSEGKVEKNPSRPYENKPSDNKKSGSDGVADKTRQRVNDTLNGR